MKIAVIGSGISGLVAAHTLADNHEVTLFEAASRLGGHTATMDIHHRGRNFAIDTGFIVFNDWTYPEFIALMDRLKVASQPTRMSFSLSDKSGGLEYAGTSLDTLFAQRRNLASPRHWRMLLDILRFNRQVEAHLATDAGLATMSLGDYLARHGYSRVFTDYYLVPMGAAIWSAGRQAMLDFPLPFFVRFFRNHGLLNLKHRPQWRVIQGGSRAYIKPLTANLAGCIELGNPVHAVSRIPASDGGTRVRVASHKFNAEYDQVVFACHSDQALALLQDPDPLETRLLSAIPYNRNEVVLHTDISLLPASRRCWSSWNVTLAGRDFARPTLTYNMNILQGIDYEDTFCVTLNQTGQIDPAKILGVYHYDHPVFTGAGVRAQQQWQAINGVRGTWYCGAWWRNGFHEDGVWSALRVARGIEASALAPAPTWAEAV